MSFERSYSIESHERIKLILIFADKSLLLKWWVTYAVCSIICLSVLLQKSFYARLTNDKNSEKFLKVIHDRMTDAQAEIKSNYSVTAGDALANANVDDGKEVLSQHETKVKGKNLF